MPTIPEEFIAANDSKFFPCEAINFEMYNKHTPVDSWNAHVGTRVKAFCDSWKREKWKDYSQVHFQAYMGNFVDYARDGLKVAMKKGCISTSLGSVLFELIKKYDQDFNKDGAAHVGIKGRDPELYMFLAKANNLNYLLSS